MTEVGWSAIGQRSIGGRNVRESYAWALPAAIGSPTIRRSFEHIRLARRERRRTVYDSRFASL